MALANLRSKEENRQYVSEIFERMYTFSFSFTCCLIPLTKIVTEIILSPAYRSGSVYIGFLYLGAIINLFINLVLIKKIGLFAAAISTYAGFLVMWIVRMHDIKNDWPIRVKKVKFATMTIVATITAILTIWTSTRLDLVMVILFGTVFLYINKEYLMLIAHKILKRNIK